MDYDYIKKVVFDTVDFTYTDEIEFYNYDGGIRVDFNESVAGIGANSKAAFARGCFLLAMNISEGKTEFSIEEKPHFDKCGAMVDCSRNAVMTVESVKKYINCLAALGMNLLMLYTEDTYEIEGRPRFGYLRGRYTKSELKEIVAYGNSLGVELVPCIQTLAHMEQYLRWSRGGAPDYTGEEIYNLTDTERILLCESPATMRLIEDEIRTCREVFTTDNIHIGMDEAGGIGLGRYLTLHGYKENKFEIMMKHLKEVIKICDKYNFKPMMWSDMFFRLNTGGEYYDFNFNFTDEQLASIPDVNICYWDYYHSQKEVYDGMLKKHSETGKPISFAGAIVSFWGHLPLFDYSYENSCAALKSCIENSCKTVFATMWGDDGNECNIFLTNPLLPVFSEHCYKGSECTEADISTASEYLTKIKFQAAKKMGDLSYQDGDELFLARRLFYDDVLYNLGIEVSSCDNVIKRYRECEKSMDILRTKKDKNEPLYNYAYLIYKTCIAKAEIIRDLRKAYLDNNRKYLKKACDELLPNLKRLYEEFHACHKKQWYATYKRFGFEVLSFRYGGLCARIDDAIEIISMYLNGDIDEIDELKDERLINEEGYADSALHIITPSVKI